MKFKIFFFWVALSFATFSNAQIVISEIMYNNPGSDDLEYLELYNTGLTDVDLVGYTLATAVDYTFGVSSISAGGYFIIAKDSVTFENVFGIQVNQWTGGSLKNSSENIQLFDASTQLVDEVTYDDDSPWSTLADGYGASLVLCDTKADNNDPAFWRAANTSTNNVFQGTTIFGNPMSASECSMVALVGFDRTDGTIVEDGDSIALKIIVNNPGDTFTLNFAMNASSTAGPEDFTLSMNSVTIPGNIDTTLIIHVGIVDDSDEESQESLIIDMVDPDNQTVFLTSSYTLEITDNDGTLANGLILTGIYDAQPSISGTKGIELYVRENIADLSIYGVGFANNGGGTDGVEYTFPAVSATAGEFIYVALDSTLFRDFFGFDATFSTDKAGINGDDAVELFESGLVIDVFGDINVDGNGTPWEYLDGWAYRKPATGPDGSDFVLENWTFSGVDGLNGAALNVDAPSPYPIGTFTLTAPEAFRAVSDNVTIETNEVKVIDVLANDVRVDLLSGLITITTMPSHGTVVVNTDSTLTYTPSLDYCGDDSFTYQGCEIGGCSDGTVNITINCPILYPTLSIGTVTQNNADGISTYFDSTCTLVGLVYGLNLRDNGLSFTIIDDAGDGINVFKASGDLGYVVAEGDEVSLKGKLGQYNGLTEFFVNDVTLNSSGNTLATSTIVTTLDESTESQLVTIENVNFLDPSEWGGSGSGFNFTMVSGTDTFALRIDNDVDLFMESIPTGSLFTVTGIGGQFDSSTPYDSGYQLFPRYSMDFTPIVNVVTPDYAQGIQIYPNPTNDVLSISTGIEMDHISIINSLGQIVLDIDNPLLMNDVDVRHFDDGMYFIQFVNNEKAWSQSFIKQ